MFTKEFKCVYKNKRPRIFPFDVCKMSHNEVASNKGAIWFSNKQKKRIYTVYVTLTLTYIVYDTD